MDRKFDGKNYRLWAWHMELLLTQERVWTIVNGSEKSPPGPEEAIEEVVKDGKVLVPGKAAVPESDAYKDYMWRYYHAVLLIFGALADSIQPRYIGIEDPATLWREIKRHYFEEPQRPRFCIWKDLHGVKLEDCGSVDAYTTRIQDLIDEYGVGTESAPDGISEIQHVFFLWHGLPRSDEWDVTIRLIPERRDLDDDPKAVIKVLRDREDVIKSLKGIPAEVALYTKDGALASGKSAKKDARTCYFCEQSGHIKRHCPERKDGFTEA